MYQFVCPFSNSVANEYVAQLLLPRHEIEMKCHERTVSSILYYLFVYSFLGNIVLYLSTK